MTSVADANILLNQARLISQRHLVRFDEHTPVETLVQQLADYKHLYTQTGGLRPFGVSLMYAGWDEARGFQLYLSDPAGNYGGWHAAAMGSNSGNATSFLKDEYKEGMSVTDALDLAVTTLLKALDTTSPSADRVDVAVLTLKGGLGDATAGASAASSAASSATAASADDSATAARIGMAGGLSDATAAKPCHRVLAEAEVTEVIERVRDRVTAAAEASAGSS